MGSGDEFAMPVFGDVIQAWLYYRQNRLAGALASPVCDGFFGWASVP